MSFQAGGREAHAHQKAAQNTRSPLEEIQIRRHAQQVQKAHISGRFSFRTEALQHGLYLSIMLSYYTKSILLLSFSFLDRRL